MKTLARILLIPLGIIAVAMLFQSCTNERYSIEQSILVDQTEDSFLVKPDAESHKKLFESKELWAGFRFRVSAITDVSYNPAHESSIAPACQLLGNLPGRKKEQKAFFAKIDTALQTLLDTRAGKTKSSIFFPMTMELTRLSKGNAERKILAIYSDMMEHTSTLSFYDKKTQELLKNDSDSVRRILEIEAVLPDLSGTEIYFVYQPRTSEESSTYRIVSDFFKDWLESKGAKVVIAANFSDQ